MAGTNLQVAIQFLRGRSFVGLARKYGMTSLQMQEKFRLAVETPAFQRWAKRLRGP